MTKREMAALSCKLLGIYAALSGLSTLQGNLMTAFSLLTYSSRGSSASAAAGTSREQLITALIAGFTPCVALLLAALILWTMADFLAALMTRKSSGDAQVVASHISARDVQAIGFSLFGLWSWLQSVGGIGR